MELNPIRMMNKSKLKVTQYMEATKLSKGAMGQVEGKATRSYSKN